MALLCSRFSNSPPSGRVFHTNRRCHNFQGSCYPPSSPLPISLSSSWQARHVMVIFKYSSCFISVFVAGAGLEKKKTSPISSSGSASLLPVRENIWKALAGRHSFPLQSPFKHQPQKVRCTVSSGVQCQGAKTATLPKKRRRCRNVCKPECRRQAVVEITVIPFILGSHKKKKEISCIYNYSVNLIKARTTI